MKQQVSNGVDSGRPAAVREPRGGYRLRSLATVLKMGHCAPAVMRNLLDISAPDEEWLVRLSAGMPGGIGNTGSECGAMTSSLALLGLHYGLRETDKGLPVVFDKGHALCQHFLKCHRTLLCKEIRGHGRFPRRCIRPIVLSPELYLGAMADGSRHSIPEDIREGYSGLYSHMTAKDFHCAHAVFDQLGYRLPDHQQLFDVTSAFVGGTLFMGLTCSAFTAGVMAFGLIRGEIENNPLRVLRMIAIMTTGGNAFDESLNAFNLSMNTGYRMSKWFKGEFGSTQCRTITRCDFSSPLGVREYAESDCVGRCREITEKVAEWVRAQMSH